MGNLAATVAPDGIREESEGTGSNRRGEVRIQESKVCVYGLCESIEGGRVVIEQGEAYGLDRSERGILVLMGTQPRKQQLLELHVPRTRWEYALNLYEVQWTKILPVESQGNLFLVGCRLVLGASRYWTFNPEMRRSAGSRFKKEQANQPIRLSTDFF
ncbi:MAG: hypothetical protein OEV01_08120 [Nitrospira sp.]|nr:hypothetical protein [Nitrospira sp.]MDH4304466.1 hypothetical protein [Nitrospira sp.]MDH5193979.1 hypothetical protein [Nitrospira sp.]